MEHLKELNVKQTAWLNALSLETQLNWDEIILSPTA
jgi:hypothetical protein